MGGGLDRGGFIARGEEVSGGAIDFPLQARLSSLKRG
jgi:hypothetical protein